MCRYLPTPKARLSCRVGVPACVNYLCLRSYPVSPTRCGGWINLPGTLLNVFCCLGAADKLWLSQWPCTCSPQPWNFEQSVTFLHTALGGGKKQSHNTGRKCQREGGGRAGADSGRDRKDKETDLRCCFTLQCTECVVRRNSPFRNRIVFCSVILIQLKDLENKQKYFWVQKKQMNHITACCSCRMSNKYWQIRFSVLEKTYVKATNNRDVCVLQETFKFSHFWISRD